MMQLVAQHLQMFSQWLSPHAMLFQLHKQWTIRSTCKPSPERDGVMMQLVAQRLQLLS